MRWAALLFATMIYGSANAAPPDFLTSNAVYVPTPTVAGDVLHYTVTVTNTGDDSAYARIKTTLPQGYFIRTDGDCGAAIPDQDSRGMVWHEGVFSTKSNKRCQIDLLTRREAAGTLAPLVTEITTLPAGYLRLETMPELTAPVDPNAIRVGPVNITRAGLVLLAFLIFVVAGAATIARIARRSGGQPRAALGAWLAVATAMGFLLYFVGLAIGDVRTYTAYRETTCTIFDSAIRSFQGTGKSSQSNTYTSVFAVRYDVLGTETYSSTFPPITAVSLGWIGYAQQNIERFPDGSVHPCWFDPDDVKTVLLERGPGAAYLFALVPLLVLIYGLWMLLAALRKGKRLPKFEEAGFGSSTSLN